MFFVVWFWGLFYVFFCGNSCNSQRKDLFIYHRIFKVGRHLWRSSSPTPSQAGSATAGVSGLSTWVLNTSKDGYTGQPLSVFCYPHSKTEGLLMYKWSLLYFNAFPLSLVFSLDITEKSLALSSAVPPPGISAHPKHLPWALPSSPTITAPSASPQARHTNALITIQLLLYHIYFVDEIAYVVFFQESIFESWNSGSI